MREKAPRMNKHFRWIAIALAARRWRMPPPVITIIIMAARVRPLPEISRISSETATEA
jgi:hypothetical protein